MLLQALQVTLLVLKGVGTPFHAFPPHHTPAYWSNTSALQGHFLILCAHGHVVTVVAALVPSQWLHRL